MKTTVIYGPPCSGKSSKARELMTDSSALYDYDALVRAMTTRTTHELEKPLVHDIALGFRNRFIRGLADLPEDATAYILTRWPTDGLREQLAPLQPEYMPMSTPLEECLERLSTDESREDKDGWAEIIRGWFDEHGGYELPSQNEGREEVRAMSNWKRTCVLRAADFQTRAEDGRLYIDGYFAVFNSEYWLWNSAFETIDPGAFDLQADTDVRALTNHDTTLVLGRTAAGTLELRVDEKGLFGTILINEKDQDAVNLYERVKRGDVSQCSFGFDILQESTEYRADGITVFHLQRVKLWEVSVCTFPAYEDTGVQARMAEVEAAQRRRLDAWREEMRARLRGA